MSSCALVCNGGNMRSGHWSHQAVSEAPTHRPLFKSSSPLFSMASPDPTHSYTDTSQRVTIPPVPSLFDSDYLDHLYPDSTPLALIPQPRPRPISKPQPPSVANTPTSLSYADALKFRADLIRTDNGSPAFASTLSATLDAFSTLDGNVKGVEVYKLLRKAWAQNPDDTLRIIWNTRSIHEGKAAKMTFYYAFGWLYANHPKTAIGNLHMLVNRTIEKKLRKKVNKGKEREAKGEEDWTDVKEDEEPIVPVGLTHGYYKDLLNILFLATTSELKNPNAAFESLALPRPNNTKLNGILANKRRRKRQKRKAKDRKREGKEAIAEATAQRVEKEQTEAAERASETRKQKAEQAHKHLEGKLTKDRDYKALYVAVARIFGQALTDDLELFKQLESPNTGDAEKEKLKWNMTLAAKWAPSLNCAHDRVTNIATAIGMVMYESGAFADLGLEEKLDLSLGGVDEPEAHLLRGLYRRWVVSPLRKWMEIPEVKMSLNKWDKVDYRRVSSLAFRRNKEQFLKHDEERLLQYLKDVAAGTKSISGATLLPHELVWDALLFDARSHNDGVDTALNQTNMEVVNMQWNALVERTRDAGVLDNCLAVCDVSGSMGSLHVRGTARPLTQKDQVAPIFPSVALSLLLARVAKPPFTNMFITFSTNPQIVTLSSAVDAKLADQVTEMGRADWGGSTDFNAVFTKLLLPMAKRHKLKPEDMVKRIFVFSDMQFNEAHSASTGGWDTNHKQISKAYKDAGYEVPELVYWNLAGRVASKPATKETPGVAMVSGFSGNMLKMFMEGEELAEEEWDELDESGETVEKKKSALTPEGIMKNTLWKKSYDGLKVLD